MRPASDFFHMQLSNSRVVNPAIITITKNIIKSKLTDKSSNILLILVLYLFFNCIYLLTTPKIWSMISENCI